MSLEVIVALIAAGTSLLVAILGLVNSVLTNRHVARSEKSIESLKFEFSRMIAKENMIDSHLADALKALQASIRAIQVVKDEIQLITSATGDSLDASAALKRIEIAREKMFACYEDEVPNLGEWEARMTHRAKNISLVVTNLIKDSLASQQSASALGEDTRQKILALRSELTDIQHFLRDSRTDRLVRRIGNGQQSN